MSEDTQDELTLPNLNELTLEIHDHGEPYRAGKVLDGIRLPGLRNLTVRTARLTFDCLHQLLQATPQLERIRLRSIFPGVNTDLNRIVFPHITAGRLVDYAPHVRQIVIDIPNHVLDPSSVVHYLDGLAQWKGEQVGVELFCLEGGYLGPVIAAVQAYIFSQGFTGIALRQNFRDKDEDVPSWDVWHSIGT
jgi:hypothetical protein